MQDRRAPSDSSLSALGGVYFPACLLALAVAILCPFLFASFGPGEVPLVVGIEALCLALAGGSAVLLAKRLQASRRELWALSRRDPLTGVGNYRHFQERLAEEIARHGRHGREFGLIVIDLDRFKEVNETHGHLAGDRLLVEVGAGLQRVVRGEDFVFRQGGDEFAVIVEEAGAAQSAAVAARIGRRLRACGGEGVAISTGTGIVIFPADGSTAEELLGGADRDLLAAKRCR